MKKFLSYTGWPVFSGILIAIIILLIEDPLIISKLLQSPQPGQTIISTSPKPVFTYSEPISKAIPAVVSIYTTALPIKGNIDDNNKQAIARNDRPIAQGQGSGVIVDQQGHILTNQHVIENAQSIHIILNNNMEVRAKTIGIDKATDLAVLKIDPEGINIHPIISDSSEKVVAGDVVFAIGNPFGLSTSVSMGIVSAIGRYGSLGIDGGKQIRSEIYEGYIQTDAFINPGNSGGALINAHGHLIGINSSFKSSSEEYQGVGFAIPINLATQLMSEIIKHGKVIRGHMGFTGAPLDQQLAETLGIDNAHGIIVFDVRPNSPADKAGLKPEDIITHINQNIVSAFDLKELLTIIKPGERVKMNVIHKGQHKTIDIIVGINPKDLQLSKKQ